MRRHRKSNKWQQQSDRKLTSQEIIALRLESPDLRPSKHIVAIHIEWGIDWCIRQAGDMVRRHRMKEKRRQNVLTFPQKTPFDTSRRIHAYPKALPQTGSNSALIDVSDRRNSEWDDIESTKSDSDTDDRNTHLVTKNRLSTRAAGSTPIPSYCLHWHRMPHRLMHHTGATMG